ncbi:hypothetical protein F5148DRAFT_1149521 [Russula earlei]|uniref:Uncharacterized protein n=1 Tax=Russula earlei TaxID=71964 RepID=A0ACC0U972_9AGAM|nr:hypothetical protein F5148DRAFT_1149521 [Russula earlei]
MLSRFSSLFVYVVAGLVISAAATPMVARDSDDAPKSPSYPYPPPRSPPPKYSPERPYAPSYPDEKKPEEYPKAKYPKELYSDEGKYPAKYPDQKKPYPDDKSKPYPDDKDKPYPDDKDKSHTDDKDPNVSVNKQVCSVGEQQCCNWVYDSNGQQTHGRKRQDFGDILEGLLDFLTGIGEIGLTDEIQDSGKGAGVQCSPRGDSDGDGGHCEFSPAMCCADNKFGGLLAIGCSPIDLDLT